MKITEELKKLADFDKKYREIFKRSANYIEVLEESNKELVRIITVMNENMSNLDKKG